jgi:hypothetical protein
VTKLYRYENLPNGSVELRTYEYRRRDAYWEAEDRTRPSYWDYEVTGRGWGEPVGVNTAPSLAPATAFQRALHNNALELSEAREALERYQSLVWFYEKNAKRIEKAHEEAVRRMKANDE